MPPASTIATLSPELRDELNRRLVASGYGRLEEQAQWLRDQGVQIGKSAVGEYSKGLKATLEKSMERARTRVEVAKAMGAMSESDKAALLEANEMVLLDKVMDFVDDWDAQDWGGAGPEARAKALSQIIRASSDIGSSARATAKMRREIEAEVRRQALEEAAKSVEAAAQAKGMDEQEAGFWVQQVLKVF